MVYIKLHHCYTFPDIFNHKLFQQRAGFFEIINKIGHLIYELKFPFRIFIYPVISIEPIFYGRQRDQHLFPVQTENLGDIPAYKIEHFINKKTRRNGKIQYRVQWKNYGPEYNVGTTLMTSKQQNIL